MPFSKTLTLSSSALKAETQNIKFCHLFYVVLRHDFLPHKMTSVKREMLKKTLWTRNISHVRSIQYCVTSQSVKVRDWCYSPLSALASCLRIAVVFITSVFSTTLLCAWIVSCPDCIPMWRDFPAPAV